MSELIWVFLYGLALVGCGFYLLYKSMQDSRSYEGAARLPFFAMGAIAIVLVTLGILVMTFVSLHLPR